MMQNKNNQSGQAIVGGLFFLIILMSIFSYFIYLVNTIDTLYFNTTQKRFELIESTSKYANILNQISINNQNIIASIMSAQVAYISSIENGITVSYEQPYWQTYSQFAEQNYALSNKSKTAVEKSFQANRLISGKSFFVAASLADKNRSLIKELPVLMQSYFSESSNSFIHCLSLEFLEPELHNSNFLIFPIPQTYQFGISKSECSLIHKNNSFRKLLHTSLPVLYSNDSDLIISFNRIDEYLHTKDKFSYGITYVKEEFAEDFVQNLKFTEQSTSNSTVRLKHPKFICSKEVGKSYSEENLDTCTLLKDRFFQSFLQPNWSAIVTAQKNNKIL